MKTNLRFLTGGFAFYGRGCGRGQNNTFASDSVSDTEALISIKLKAWMRHYD